MTAPAFPLARFRRCAGFDAAPYRPCMQTRKDKNQSARRYSGPQLRTFERLEAGYCHYCQPIATRNVAVGQ